MPKNRVYEKKKEEQEEEEAHTHKVHTQNHKKDSVFSRLKHMKSILKTRDKRAQGKGGKGWEKERERERKRVF